jgi:sterol desaturase/sphingolipid hydroxylase (fatty acid hydroxylase superfamily)
LARKNVDLTVIAIPVYFGTMGVEYLRLRNRAGTNGPSPVDYERRDTIASLTMGVGSLVAPFVLPRLFRSITPGKGRYGTALLATTAGAAAITTAADRLVRLEESRSAASSPGPEGTDYRDDPEDRLADPPAGRVRRRSARVARRVASVGGVVTIALGGVAVASAWASRTTVDRLWRRRLLPDLGTGAAAKAAAVFGWDFIYYWNHRLMHESRAMWAIHVVHHSSERYNLSTALRQPVADALGLFAPYGALGLVGIRPELIGYARGVNLLYQYWIHTDTIKRLGPLELVMNTPSHHRVHHGSNPQYIDKNYGSILIVWDRAFRSFEPEVEPVVYGLTKNIKSFRPTRIAGHEYGGILRDVAWSRSWRERLSYVLLSPGWAYSHVPGDLALGDLPVDAPPVDGLPVGGVQAAGVSPHG